MGGSEEDTGSGTKRRPKKEKRKQSKKKKQKNETSQEQPLLALPVTQNQQNTEKNKHTIHHSQPVLSSSPPSTTAAQLSWGDLFATASSVKPISLGDDFMQSDETEFAEVSDCSGNIGMVSQVAKEYLDASRSRTNQIGKVVKDVHQNLRENGGFTAAKHMKRKDINKNDINIDEGSELEKQIDFDVDPEFNESPKKKRKKERKKKKTKKLTSPSSDKSSTDPPITENPLESGPLESGDEDTFINRFPYSTDPDDHCESPGVAYEDILPILHTLASMKRSQIRIYDPYYCNGAVIPNLAKIGFNNVYNKKEDCYKTWSITDSAQPYPAHDVLVTNPPYSGDHIQRLMKHVTSDSTTTGRLGTEAWCLLMPNFVHKKDYFKNIVKKDICEPFYLVPKKRYVYVPPKNFRAKKQSDVHKKSSPFVSMWYVWGGTKKKNDELIDAYRVQGRCSNCTLARSKSALRDLRRKKS